MVPDKLTIIVAYGATAQQVDLIPLTLPAGSTVFDALRQSGLLERYPSIDLTMQRVGVWGKLKPLTEPLRDGDRVELYRPLQIDPKEARRQRHQNVQKKT